MPQQITMTVSAQVQNGPRFDVQMPPLEVDAVDVVKVTLPIGVNATPSVTTVDVQPSAAGNVSLFMLKLQNPSDYARPGGAASRVKYSLSANPAAPIPIDGPVTLIGPGAVGLMGGAPTKLYFWTPAAPAVPIEIIVGRKA